MDVRKKQIDSSQQTFLYLASKSKQEFIRAYKKYDETRAEQVYLKVLIELTMAISEGNVDSLKQISNLIEYVGEAKSQVTLRDYYNNSNNPIKSTNIVILACKHNKVEILKVIFSNNKLIDNLSIKIGKDAVAPYDKDETCHDAFYYAIRSGNVKLLDTLINTWPNDYISVCSEKFDEVLSKGYEELKLKNVPLSDEIEIFVQNKLINLRFFSNSSVQVQSFKDDLKIEARLGLVLENIALLKTEYLNKKEVDEKFLFIAKFIAQNIHVLKRHLKSSYDRLPWEEIEFCLVCFVSCHIKRQEINLFYRSTLSKTKILNHLEYFAKKLEDEKHLMEERDIGKLSNLPKLKREQVVLEIIANCCQFEELYKDYQQIRDIHSLEKINNYIMLALSADPKNNEGKLSITRGLQVIGEHLKNTIESPKLSNTTSELLLLSLPKNTRKIIMDLRNSLSHAYSLSKRTEIEESMDVNYFCGVQNDIKKVGVVVTDILFKNKIKMVRILLTKILNSNNLDEMKEVAFVFSTVEWDSAILENLKIIEQEKLEILIKELSDNITDKTNYVKEMFNNMNHIINSAGTSLENTSLKYLIEFESLRRLCKIFSEMDIDHNVIRGIKYIANKILTNKTQKREHRNLKEIAELSLNIYKSVESGTQFENLDDVKRLVCEIFYIAEFGTGDMKYIDELRSKLNERGSFIPFHRQKKTDNATAENYDKQLQLKLSELKGILSNKLLIDISDEKLKFYKKDKQLQSVVEMLVLDIMSILGTSSHCLEHNVLFLDDHTPLLNGKCLRNHLAHDNTLVDILISEPSIIVILNAKKLIEENLMKTKKRIGKLVNDDPFKLKEKFNQGLVNINHQNRMFIAVEEGNLETLRDCLKRGADINARNINSWTTLHFAAKGPSLEVIQFILDQSLSLNVRDVNGQSPLHVAAAFGRRHIVDFLVKEAGLDVYDGDNMEKTPLHVAAQHGNKDTVEVLLENNAHTTIQDVCGHSPLHYAILNNHIDVAKLLLAKDANVEINESAGGFTPLHEAAERGQMELVNFLLEHKADVNARNDRKWTALHAAALNGHLEVVNTLILKGADVKARLFDGCTPLHYAVETGHEKIVIILLTNGANVNAADTIHKNTPLHYAAKDGYVGIVKILLDNKANASADTVEGITPLHFAARSNHLEIVTSLLKHGVSINAKDKYKATPLNYAVECGNKEVAEVLLTYGAEVNAKDNNDTTPLHVATLKGNQAIADLLIRNEAGVNAQDINGNTPLHAAAMNGSIGVIELLLQNKSKVNQRTNAGIMPLHLAATKGHLDAVVSLIQNKADVNGRANDGFTPLHSAVIGGHKDIINILMKNKAQIDARATGEYTPLYIAVEVGHKEIVEILVANGANINVKCRNLMPLHSAIKSNNKEIAEVLIANGANIHARGSESILLAVIIGNRDIVDILLKNKARVDIKYSEDATLLHMAAKRGHKEIVNALIKSGANVNAITINNTTPLYLAAQEDYEDVVEILITNRANFNLRNIEGSPLHIAAGRGHDSVVKVLLNNGAEITKDNKNRTPLELAVFHGHLQVVQMLLRYKKVDMNNKGNDNWTILHIASQVGNLEMVKYLVTEGSDINAKNASGSKAIHIAARQGHKDIVDFFLTKGLSINEAGAVNHTVLHYAAMSGQLEVVKYLISQRADVNAQDANGFSPMHLAANFGFKDVVEVLLKNGAVYNAGDKLVGSPLQMSEDKNVINLLATTEMLFIAVNNGNTSEVESYIQAGAIVNAKNANGETPLHYAARKGYDAVITVLLQNKADPNVANKKGITPLHYAANFSHLKIVMALLSHGAVHNPVSDSGETPLDLAVYDVITMLLQLVSESFENIKNDNSKYINELNKINDVDTIKAIMGACNKKSETLIVAAAHSTFSKLEQLKEILQGNISSQINIALVLANQGNYQQALGILKSAFKKRKEILGPTNPGTLDIQRHIARVLYAQGLYEEALNTLQYIFQQQREMLGLDNNDTLSTWSMIALVLHRQGKDEEAFNIYQEVFKKQNEKLGPNHEDTLDTQLHMALVLDRQGKYDEALIINKEVFEKRTELSGSNAQATLLAQNNIAMVMVNQGKLGEALKIYREVYEKKKVVFGLNHSSTLKTLHNIAGVLSSQNKHHEALKKYQEVFSTQKNFLGPNHPETLTTQYNIANELLVQQKYYGALKAFRECLDQTKDVFGHNHPKVLIILEKMEMIKLCLNISDSKEWEILQHLPNEMIIAVTNGDTKTVQRLINDGVDANDKDINGRTPLHYAVSNRRIHIVNILLKAGADVTQVTNKGNTSLHTATSKGYTEIVEVLLQHVNRDKLNDFVNAKTTASGTTALHVAIKSGYFEIVKSLLRHGAFYDITNKDSKMPHDYCVYQNVTDLLKLIEELFRDAKNGGNAIINKLQAIKSDEFLAVTNARNTQGNTLLQVAITNKNMNIAAKLLAILKIPPCGVDN